MAQEFKVSKASLTSKIPKVLILEITPAMAEVMLSTQAKNRPIKPRQVDAFFTLMERGEFRLTNQGIGFDRAGHLIDGQHRLNAVLLYGKPVTMLVTLGLDPEAFMSVDNAGRIGSARGPADFFALAGFPDPKVSSERARAYYVLVNPADWKSSNIDPRRMLAFAETIRTELDWAAQHMPRMSRGNESGLTQAGVVAGWMYARRATSEIDRLVAPFIRGANLQDGSPVLALRNGITNGSLVASIQGERLGLSLKTLNALAFAVTREPVTRLFASANGLRFFSKLAQDDVGAKYANWRAA